MTDNPTTAAEPPTTGGPKPMRYDDMAHHLKTLAASARLKAENASAPTQPGAEPIEADYAAAAAELEPQTETDSAATESEEPLLSESDSIHSDDGANLNREAAKYRTRLRATETRLDAAAGENARLHDIVERMQIAEAERLADGILADGSDLWRADVTLDDLLTDGHVDPGKVAAAAKGTAAQHQHWAPPPRRRSGFQSGATGAIADQRPVSFKEAFAPRRE
jgi:hypothetical protein